MPVTQNQQSRDEAATKWGIAVGIASVMLGMTKHDLVAHMILADGTAHPLLVMTPTHLMTSTRVTLPKDTRVNVVVLLDQAGARVRVLHRLFVLPDGMRGDSPLPTRIVPLDESICQDDAEARVHIMNNGCVTTHRFSTDREAFEMWKSLPRKVKAAFRAIGDTSPVRPHDYVQR